MCGGRGETRGFPQAGAYVSIAGKEKRRTGAGWAYGGDSGSVPSGRTERVRSVLRNHEGGWDDDAHA